MKESDRTSFAKELSVLAETLGAQLSDVLLEGYWRALTDIEFGAFRSAVNRAMRSCAFMPKPSELRELSGETTVSARAELAWNTAFNFIGRIGGYVSPNFTDPAINATIRSLGGWITFTGKETEELLRFVRPAFLKTYAAYHDRAAGEAGKRLVGMHEQTPDGKFQVVEVECSYLPESEQRRLPAPEPMKEIAP